MLDTLYSVEEKIMKLAIVTFSVLLVLSVSCNSTLENSSDDIIENIIRAEPDTVVEWWESIEVDIEDLDFYCLQEAYKGLVFDSAKIEEDKKLIKKINRINLLNAEIRENLLKLPQNKHLPIDIGNELIRHHFEINGNYINLKIYTIEYQGEYIEYAVKYNCFKELFHDKFYKLINVEIDCRYNALRYIKWNKRQLEKYTEKYPDIFWRIPKEVFYWDRGYLVLDFFTYFIGNEGEYNIGGFVDWNYIGEAMDNARYLIVNKDIETLEKIICSPNKRGRVIGATILEYMNKDLKIELSTNTIKKMENVFKTDGEGFYVGPFSCHFDERPDFVNIRKDFKKYLAEM